MSKRSECSTEGCPLTPVKFVFPDLEGADPDKCYRCAPDEARHRERALRVNQHRQWLASGAVENARNSLADLTT